MASGACVFALLLRAFALRVQLQSRESTGFLEEALQGYRPVCLRSRLRSYTQADTCVPGQMLADLVRSLGEPPNWPL